jgi:predicted nucleic acid-binding protein
LIILDTNVLSEMMRLDPDAVVTKWLSARPAFDQAAAQAYAEIAVARRRAGRPIAQFDAQIAAIADPETPVSRPATYRTSRAAASA